MENILQTIAVYDMLIKNEEKAHMKILLGL